MYSEEERRFAVDLWFEMWPEMSEAAFVSELGWPCASTLRRWVMEDPRFDPDKPRHDSRPVLDKLEAIRRVADGWAPGRAAAEAGVSRNAAARWVDAYARGGTAALLPKRKGAAMAGRERGAGRRPAPAMERPPAAASGPLPDDPAALRAMVEELRADNAVLREVLDVLKADPGCDPADLTSAERARVAASLGGRFPLPALLGRLGLPRSTYCYQLERMTRPDAPDALGDAVEEEFWAEGGARGYRTVWARLRRRPEPVVASEKRVRAKMRERGLRVVYAGRRRRYSSYGGEPDGRPANLPLRPDGTHDFSADAPNRKWASDITEFSLPDDRRKVYLSPVIDLFDGKPVGWAVGLRPDAGLADSSLRRACARLRPGERPFAHTDGGIHYRWPGWKRICAEHGLERSMSRKGMSPDNAACEGFFGNMKNEMFHGRDWRGATAEQLAVVVDRWMADYSTARLKAFREGGRTVYDTIDGRRERLGLAT